MTTRKFFGTDGIRGEVGGAVINAEFALRLGYAAGRVLARRYEQDRQTEERSSSLHEQNPSDPQRLDSQRRNRPAVLIGKDTRLSGYMLESALEAGLAAAGIDILLAGPVPTPAVAYLTRALRLAAGIVISASHNPYQDNGIKFFSEQGMKLPDAMEAEIECALTEPLGCVDAQQLGRARRIDDAAGRYIEFCKSHFPNDLDLTGLSIVVDAAHGAAYHIAPYVLRELGAHVHAVGVSPNGFNINEGVGALYPDKLAREVLARGADLGIALDGDADRLQMVDRAGRVYNGDELLYAIVRERRAHGPVAGVVGTLMTNYGFERKMADLGIGFERAHVGDRYVLERLLARGWRYGGESSGHLICLDCHTTGDGMIAALQVLTALRRHASTLADWVADLHMYPQHMINVPISPGLDWQAHPGLSAARREIQASLSAGRGRVLIRASGTEPKLRLMVEAEDAALAAAGAQQLAAALAGG